MGDVQYVSSRRKNSSFEELMRSFGMVRRSIYSYGSTIAWFSQPEGLKGTYSKIYKLYQSEGHMYMPKHTFAQIEDLDTNEGLKVLEI